ncbi:hypothetical protein ACIBJF_17920 [Streptomyces sp. NPDC050743]|uniref:hypothetical protein n=1 Tax=Streptomyces sp. NPDC050743 TaxID=3365634 RepID=UPI0037AFAD91
MILSASLTCFIALIFALLGVAKILALGPMPELAAHGSFTTAAYRVIGGLELAGAIGVGRRADQTPPRGDMRGPDRLVSRTPRQPLTRSGRLSAATRPVSEPTAGLAD